MKIDASKVERHERKGPLSGKYSRFVRASDFDAMVAERDGLLKLVQRFVQVAPACLDSGGVAVNIIAEEAKNLLQQQREVTT